MGTAHRQRATRPGGRAGSPLWSCAVVGARVSARPAHLQRCMSSMPPPNPMPRFIAAVRANLRAREREPAREHRKGGTARRRFANRSLFYILHIVRTCAQTPRAYPGDPSKKSCGKFRGDAVTRRRWWVSCDVRGRTIQFEEAVIGSEEERCTALAGAAAAARGATDKNQFSLAGSQDPARRAPLLCPHLFFTRRSSGEVSKWKCPPQRSDRGRSQKWGRV